MCLGLRLTEYNAWMLLPSRTERPLGLVTYQYIEIELHLYVSLFYYNYITSVP